MRCFARIITALALTLCSIAGNADPFTIVSGNPLTVSYPEKSRPILRTAIDLFGQDIDDVFGDSLYVVDSDARIRIMIAPEMVKEEQGFRLSVDKQGILLIAGHDSYGAAYGIIELSRLIGVSPWEWWADAKPLKKERFELPEGFSLQKSPSVRYRGIFINDEDWGLMPWSSKTFEPSDIPGHIGPRTNAKIFELMLRLRANTYWPAMHECSVPFFMTDGNREVAERYGIYIGGSHCEPMACNAAGEWARRGIGDYDYVNNSQNVNRFWEDRVKDVANQEILYTIGMRGVHDGAMNGAKTIEEQKNVLARVFRDQRKLLSEYVNRDVTKVPQVFIPYKEVLDVYNAGLRVPEDVTLMWCDDNYGYIRHFPTEEESGRKGGNGVYYHVSYWGRPHDYLWLGTFSPYLLYQQMKTAYDKGIRDIWILNVGDIKPAEYQMELFMDMAWNIAEVESQGPSAHLAGFLSREFGDTLSKELYPVMNEYYRLAFIRKPEFMGNTREEEWGNDYYKIVRDLPWSLDSINRRDSLYQNLSDIVENVWNRIPDNRKDTYYQLIKYPVQASAQMNRKMISAQKARHGLSDWTECDVAFDSIASLTRTYNRGFGNNGKWNLMMDCQPRRLPVFDRVDKSPGMTPMPCPAAPVAGWNGVEATGRFDVAEGLGYESGAIILRKGEGVTFNIPAIRERDSITIDVRTVPTHPIEDKGLVFSLEVDGETIARDIHYETKGRSEEWKENVLRNQAVRKVRVRNDGRAHKLTLVPETEGIILDQVLIF